jgi:ribosomal protein L24E
LEFPIFTIWSFCGKNVKCEPGKIKVKGGGSVIQWYNEKICLVKEEERVSRENKKI